MIRKIYFLVATCIFTLVIFACGRTDIVSWSGVGNTTVDFGAQFDPLQGVVATSAINGVIPTENITVTGNVNTNVPGAHELHYKVTGGDRREHSISRTVTVLEEGIKADTITWEGFGSWQGANLLTIKRGTQFDPKDGIKVTSEQLGVIAATDITVSGSVNANVVGNYVLTYGVVGGDGTVHTNTRTVSVNAPTEIIFWHAWGLANQGVLDRIIESFFETHPQYAGFTINHESQGGWTDLNRNINMAIPASGEPHFAFAYPDHVAGYLLTGRVMNMDPFINDPVLGFTAQDIDDFIPNFWNEGMGFVIPDRLDGFTGRPISPYSMYLLPVAKSTEALFFNETFFTANGLVMPDLPTWEDLISLADQIIALNPSNLTRPIGFDSQANLYIVSSHQLGIPYTSATAPNIIFDNPAARNMVRWMQDNLIATNRMQTGDMAGIGGFNSGPLMRQEVFMNIGSTGGTQHTVNWPVTIPQDQRFNVAVRPSPVWTDNLLNTIWGDLQTSGGAARPNAPQRGHIQQGPSITMFRRANALEVEVSWAFIRYLTNPVNSALIAMNTGFAPVRTSSFYTDELQAFFANPTPQQPGHSQQQAALIAQALQLSLPMRNYFMGSPAFPRSALVRNAVNALLLDVFEGVRTVDQAFVFHYNQVAL